MQTEYRFLSPEQLSEDLFAACLESGGKELTMRVLISAYQQDFVRSDADSEWESKGCTGLEQLGAATKRIKEFLSEYPEFRVRFPQVVISDERETTIQNAVTVRTGGYADITIPESFSAAHSGYAFRTLLHEKWEPNLEKLAESVVKKLRHYEFRTARLFAPQDTHSWKFRICCGKEDVYTDVWSISYEKLGFYPLLWHTEVSGLCGLLCEALTKRLHEDNRELSARIYRDGTQQCCIIELELKEAHT